MARWFAPVPDPNLPPDEWPGLMVVAATILGEAAGEPTLGKRAVAYVIANRCKDERWPDTGAEVCLQRRQFSCWNVGSVTLPCMYRPQKHATEEVWNACVWAALDAEWRLEPDPTHGANHYLNEDETRRIRDGSLPSWFREGAVTVRIGRHTFLRL